MILKLNAARRYLEREAIQVSVEAAAALALTLDQEARELAGKTVAILEKENIARQVQGLPPRVRLTAEDVKRAAE